MDRESLNSDPDLGRVVCQANGQELGILVKCLRKAASCYLDESCVNPVEIVDEFQKLGGNTVANKFRGHGVEYKEIMFDVAHNIGTKIGRSDDIAQMEWIICEHVLHMVYKKLKKKDKEEFDVVIRRLVRCDSDIDYWRQLQSPDCHIARLELQHLLVEAVSDGTRLDRPSSLTSIGTGFGAGLGIGGGPVGIAIGAVVGTIVAKILSKLLYGFGPAYKATVPGVFVIAYIRSRVYAEEAIAEPSVPNKSTIRSQQPVRVNSSPHCLCCGKPFQGYYTPGSKVCCSQCHSIFVIDAKGNPKGVTVMPDQNEMPSFHISVSPDKDVLEAWSMHHVSYPPRSEEHQFLKELKDQLRVLHSANAVGVHAVYGSPIPTRGDIENILFYNIGRWETVPVSRPLLRFERLHSILRTCPVPISGKPIHYYRYQLVPVDSDFILREIRGPSLIEFEATCATTDFGAKCGPGPIWLAVCRTMSQSGEPRHLIDPYQGRFGMKVTLTVPASVRQNRSFKMKTIFDGIISALHSYDGPHTEEVASRLAKKLCISQEEIRELLVSSEYKVLGDYQMVRPYRASVMFSPKDDLCDAGELCLKVSRSVNEIIIRGQVFEITE